MSSLLPGLWAASRLWPDLPSVYFPPSLIAPLEVLTYEGTFTWKRVGAVTYYLLQRWAWGHADAVISHTPTITTIRNRYYGVAPTRVVHAAPGVDLDRFVPQDRDPDLLKSLGIPPTAPLVICICRLIKFKDLPFLLRAFALEQVPRDAHLLLVGDGPRRGHLETLVARRGLSDRVHFAGFRQDVERYYPLGHVYVLPSFLETFGLTILQAMACAIPTIARKTEYPRVLTAAEDLIDDGGTGFIIATEVELADRLRTLLVDARLREAMGREARLRAMRFTWRGLIDAVEDAIRLASDARAAA